MPLPWNPNSPAKIGLEHENAGYAAARIGGPADWLALRFVALNTDDVDGIWLQADSGASAPELPITPHNVAAGLRGPICVDMYRAGDEVQGDVSNWGADPSSFTTVGTILDETLTPAEISDVTAEGDGTFMLSPNTVSYADFGFNAVTGVPDTHQILDVRLAVWNRKSARIYRVDDKNAVSVPSGTFYYMDRADGTAFVRSFQRLGDGYVDWTTPTQWSRWTPAEVKEFRDAGIRRWRWRPLTASQGRLDRIQFAVSTCLDRRIGHGIAEAPDTPGWFKVPMWLPTASDSGTGPTLVAGDAYVIIIRRMNPYVPVEAQLVTTPLRYIKHPDPPLNFELYNVNTELWQSAGRTVSFYKSAGLGTKVHGLVAAALVKDTAAGTLGDHTQPYTLHRPVAVYNGRNALQYFTTPSSPGGPHQQVYVTLSTTSVPTAALTCQVERVSDGAIVLGPTNMSVQSANQQPLVHDSVGESSRVYRRATFYFPASFTFAGSTRYRIRFSSATPSTKPWLIGALSLAVAFEPPNLNGMSFGGALDEGQGEINITGVNRPFGSDNLLSYHHSTVDDTSAMDSAPGWAEGTNTAIARTTEQKLDGTWSVKVTRLVSTADAMFWTHDLSAAYVAASGDQFTGAASFRAKTTSRSVRVDLEWINAAGAVISTTNGTSAADATGSWTQVTVTGTAPANTVRVRLRMVVLVPVANEVHYVDRMGLYRGAVALTWVAGAAVRGDLQTVVVVGPTAPGSLTATAKTLDLSPPDCLGHNHLQVEVSGSAYTKATTPDNAALDITGDLTLAWYGALDHYRGEDQIVGGKLGAAGAKSYGLMFAADGYLAIVYSSNGSVEIVDTSTVPHRFVDGQPWAVAATIQPSVFGLFHAATFYVSYDKGTTWTVLGDSVITTGAISLFSSTAALHVGQDSTGGRPAPGRHYWFRVYSGGLTGTQVANPIWTDDAVGATSDTDAAGRVWTIDAGALQAPNPTCCCSDEWRISGMPFVQLAWTATAHAGSFDRYVIQRNDDGTWRDVAYIDTEAVVNWNDWSLRLGKQVCYRMRAELTNGQVSPWSPAGGLGAVCLNLATADTGLYLGSDTVPTLQAAYTDVFDERGDRVWSLLEYGDVDLHANHGVDKQTALHPIERRGDQFNRTVVLQAICDDDRWAQSNPVANPPEEIVRLLRELTWVEMPYVVVRDHQGGRWYANVQVPTIRNSPEHAAWEAELVIAETAAEPTPVQIGPEG